MKVLPRETMGYIDRQMMAHPLLSSCGRALGAHTGCIGIRWNYYPMRSKLTVSGVRVQRMCEGCAELFGGLTHVYIQLKHRAKLSLGLYQMCNSQA